MERDNPTDGIISIAEFNRIASDVLQDRKQSNRLVDLIDLLQNVDDDDSVPNRDTYFNSLFRCLTKIFTNYIDSREMIRFQENGNHLETVKRINTYKSWLIRLYETVVTEFVRILENPEGKYSLSMQKTVLGSLIKFVEEEGKFPFRSPDEQGFDHSFPVPLLEKIIGALVSERRYNQELIEVYSNHYEYDDFIYFTMKTLADLIDDQHLKSDNANIMANILDFVHPIRLLAPQDLLPKSFQPEVKIPKPRKRRKGGPCGDHKTRMRLCELQPLQTEGHHHQPILLPDKKFKFDYERDAALYSSLWLKYLSFPMPPSTFKRVLVYLDKRALQHFANPLLLADFLISSFHHGGIISLLALSPLYTLMAKCNLEYPNFFGQLYQLLVPAITYQKHRARFLFWCDLFLTSTHLPATIVASFVKKMARLTLTSTPDTILILLPFIGNLFIRHPPIKTMLKYKQIDPDADPFQDNESDPEKTGALKSHLWELKLLQSHYLPEIGSLAKKVCTDLPRYEWKMEDLLDTTIDDVIDKTRKSLDTVQKFSYDLDCSLYYRL